MLFYPKKGTVVDCDASGVGLGAMLLQRKDGGKMHPVFYFSKRTSESKSKYHSFELETLAIVCAVRWLRIYLKGRKFRIITDRNLLTMTSNIKELNPRIAR